MGPTDCGRAAYVAAPGKRQNGSCIGEGNVDHARQQCSLALWALVSDKNLDLRVALAAGVYAAD